jgi:hypothetical protein
MIKTTVTVPYTWVYPDLGSLKDAGKTDGNAEIVPSGGGYVITRTWIDTATAQGYIDTAISHYGADTITYSTEEVTA